MSQSPSPTVFSYEGPWAASWSGNQVILWHTDEEREIARIQAHQENITACIFSIDGKRFITASKDTTLKLWDTEAVRQLFTLEGHRDVVTCCAISKDGLMIASGSLDGTVKIWDGQYGKLLHSFTTNNPVNVCSFSPVNNQLAVFHHDSLLSIFDAGNKAKLFSYSMGKREIVSCNYSFDGNLIITGSKDGIAYLGDIQSGTTQIVLKGHTGSIFTCAFSLNGKYVVTGSSDKTLKVWEAEYGHELITLVGHLDDVTACAFYPHGKSICSASADGTIRVWDVATGTTKVIRKGPATLEPAAKVIQKTQDESFPRSPQPGTQDPAVKLEFLMREIFTLFLRGNYEESLHIGEKASEFAKKNFGAESLEYANTLVNLGLLNMKKGEYFFLAENSLKKALEIKRKIFTDCHPEVGELHFYLGSLFLKIDRIDEGIASLKEAIDIRKKIKNGWNEEIAKELDNLIETLDEKNRFIPNSKETRQEASMTEEEPDRFMRW